jgi:hypothetical protein
MLTRTEILEALRKMGYRRMVELKRYCRHYERGQFDGWSPRPPHRGPDLHGPEHDARSLLSP